MNGDLNLSELFAAERAVRPPAELAERGFLRLVQGLAAPVATPLAGASSTKLGWVVMSKWVLGGLVLGASGSGIATSIFDKAVPPASSTAIVAPRGVPTAPTTVREAPSSTPAEPTSAAAPAKPAQARHPSATVAAPPVVTSAERERFDAELRLIDSAKAELYAGRAHLAKVWLDEHAARYRTGVFATDREALRVLAACEARRDPDLAARFVEAHPTSPLSERLLRACSSNPK